ncbi:c-type cytochrome [Exilibacterium tricleocarpae]|uniref:C-type cytochrome n=1 Tax=Exilibacterium tricleocarpae TaxID=2591008 RepID=A0A545UBC6_9GAMM|nr:c-type cytochrome [Exilibacterium tricleocarpae]TQV86771.1 c-type cytochrome [Exilibacterium tricleocarpae]
MAVAIIMALIVVASVLFHILSPWQQTELASNWGTIDDTLLITAVICGIFFVGILLFMAYAIFRYRHREGHRAHYEPENKKLEWWLISITTVGICGMLAPGLFVYSDFVHVPDDAHVVEAVGQQWQWSYRFPGDDGELGTVDIKHITFDNPFGIDLSDPKGQDDILVSSNEVHLPLDRPVKMLLRSKDTLHNFYVPQFRVKMDTVPGLVTYFWFTPTKVGEYEVLCAEYCGVGHATMRGRVVVESEAAFRDWLSRQPTVAEAVVKDTGGSLAEQGRQLAEGLGCLACHSTDGSQSLGPGWLGLYGKTETLVDGSTVIVDEAYLKESILAPNAKLVQGYPAVMVPYDLSEAELNLLVAYTRSLAGAGPDAEPGDEPSPPPQGALEPAPGDAAARGRALAQAQGCLVCHSLDGSRGLGPTWKGMYGKTETLADGSTVVVDEAYLRESILEPNAKLVDGYPPVMQPYPLSDAQLDDLIAFTKAISEEE